VIIAALTIPTAQSAPITHIAQRSILVAVVFFTIGMAFIGMRSAWRSKSRRFADLPPPLRLADDQSLLVVGPVEGRFAGTTTAGNWLDRVTVHNLGLPQSITVSVYDSGLQLRGTSDFALWIPRADIHGVRTARGLAGDVVEPEGMIIVTWRLGYHDIDSGIRVSRHSDHASVLAALTALTALTALNTVTSSTVLSALTPPKTLPSQAQHGTPQAHERPHA